LAEVNLEFLGRQLAAVLDGQREMKADIGALKADMAEDKAALAETATRELMLRVLRSFEGQVEVARCGPGSCARRYRTESGRRGPA
jgi:hypothetical protein